MKATLIILSTCLVMLSTIVTAQTSTSASLNEGITFGIRAGVNFQNINGKNNTGDKLENKLKPGFNIGANAEIPLAQDYYIQPGILFSTKGTRVDKTDDKLNLSYLEVPVNFLYKPVLGADRLLVGFGPYIGFAVGGKYKPENGNDIDVKFQNTVSASEMQVGNYAKRFDAGANFLAGYELSSRLSFQLNAQLGLVKINPHYEIQNDKTSWKNTGFGISAGYRF